MGTPAAGQSLGPLEQVPRRSDATTVLGFWGRREEGGGSAAPSQKKNIIEHKGGGVQTKKISVPSSNPACIVDPVASSGALENVAHSSIIGISIFVAPAQESKNIHAKHGRPGESCTATISVVCY